MFTFAERLLSNSKLTNVEEQQRQRIDIMLQAMSTQPAPATTLFQRLGGAAAVDAAVDQFYQKVLSDERVNSFFAKTDMKKQRRIQKSFLTFAFGGPKTYSGVGMRKAHQKLVDEQGLNDSHMDVIVELLGKTLKDLGVGDADIGEAAAIANSVRDEVLCRDPKPKSLYERLGGAASVDAAVDQFYEKVLADKRVNYFFAKTDMKKQRRIQKSFLTFAFGGPKTYSGVGMRKAHQKLVDEQGLNDSHMDVIVELLGKTLKELGVGDADIGEAAAIANSVRDEVLCRDPKPKSLYERLGGAAAVDAAVDQFYEKVLADKRVNYFFEKTDMKKQRRIQKSFLTFAFGGPKTYSGVGMRKAHQKLVDEQGLNDTHMDVIVELLGKTLKELGVGDADIGEAAAVANSVRDEVLCRDPKPRSLYERLGGAAAVDAAVDQFYQKVLSDERVNSFFAKTDMKKQRRIQKSFLTFAFGGPKTYSGVGMRKAHQKLVDEQGLNDTHMDVIIELLGKTLKELGVGDADITEAAAIANSVRDEVLCREPKPKSLYERLGGAAAVDAAVDQFYEKVLADKRVNYFFAKTDMKKQRRIQKSFLTFAFGGPKTYSGVGMRKAHQKLVDEQGLNDTHMDVIVELLGKTLKDLGVGDADITEAAAVANSVRDEVLCREPKGDTLFNRIGGAVAVEAAVDQFYDKVLADGRVNYVFNKTDMTKQRQVQKSFLTFAFGGPKTYSGAGMRKAHKNLPDGLELDDSHMDVILEILEKTLKELGIAEADIAEAVIISNSVRSDILARNRELQAAQSLFERLGGAAAVDAAVDQFYEKVLADKRVNYFFAKTDMKKQRRIQKSFLTFAFGGPKTYSGVGMRKAHQKLVDEQGLNDTHMDVIVELLGKTLKELGVGDADITEAAAIANSVRDEVLCRDPKPKSLYERLGGAAAVDAAVDQFYMKVLADERVNYFFANTDMKKQRRIQKSFLTFAFGGPKTYSGVGMRKAHQKLVDEQGLNDSHMDVIVELLGKTLKDLGVGDTDITEAAAVANSVRDEVLCR